MLMLNATEPLELACTGPLDDQSGVERDIDARNVRVCLVVDLDLDHGGCVAQEA
jgi:hypothetical protein